MLCHIAAAEPCVQFRTRFRGNLEVEAVEDAGSVFRGVGRMILTDIEEDRKFIFYAVTEYGRHADLPGCLLATLVFLDRILDLGAHGDCDVHLALEDALDELVVQRCDLAPCGVGIA